MVTIVNHGFANVGSVLNMCRAIGVACELVSEPESVAKADFLILPGVGAFDAGMARLNETGLKEALDEAVLQRGVTLAGICLGMQFLLESSEEGSLPGLGYIKGKVVKFPADLRDEAGRTLKVPHMGWSSVSPSSNLFGAFGEGEEPNFYFVHSYFPVVENSEDSSATADYGIKFTCAVKSGNVFGFQFHPEKSHRNGMKLLDSVLPKR